MAQDAAGSGDGNAPAGPAVAAPPAGGDVGADTMTVPRNSVDDWGGDWHRMHGDAKVGRALGSYSTVVEQLQAAGVPPEQVAALFQPAAPPEGYPPQSYAAPAPGLTAADVRAMLKEETSGMVTQIRDQFGQSLQEQREQDRKDTQRQADYQRASRDEQEFMVKHLGEMGVNPLDDKKQLTPHGQMFVREFQQALNAELAESEPEGLDQEARDRHYAIASEETLNKAAERMTWLRGFKYEAALEAAQEQEEQAPAASLGAGEGGKQTPGDFDSLTREQQDAAIMEGIEVPEGTPAG